MRNGAIAPVFYSASCGGRTEIPSNVWPGADDPPHLPSADDEACEGAPAWEAELRPADLLRAFHAAGFRGNQLRDLRIVSRNSSGRVARLRVDGLTPAEISGQDLRVVVGRTLGWQHIKSTAFELRLAGERVPIHRPRVWPRCRPVRHRLDEPRRARYERDRHSSEVLSRGRHRGRRVARLRSCRSGVLVSLPDDDEGERAVIARLATEARDELAATLGVRRAGEDDPSFPPDHRRTSSGRRDSRGSRRAPGSATSCICCRWRCCANAACWTGRSVTSSCTRWPTACSASARRGCVKARRSTLRRRSRFQEGRTVPPGARSLAHPARGITSCCSRCRPGRWPTRTRGHGRALPARSPPAGAGAT